jgi:TPR repeat protein
MVRVAITLLHGKGSRRPRLRRAEKLLLRAADRGDAEAWLWLGLKRDFFDGGTKWKEAAHWYRRAARAGQVTAMVNYGRCLEVGLGIRPPRSD